MLKALFRKSRGADDLSQVQARRLRFLHAKSSRKTVYRKAQKRGSVDRSYVQSSTAAAAKDRATSLHTSAQRNITQTTTASSEFPIRYESQWFPLQPVRLVDRGPTAIPFDIEALANLELEGRLAPGRNTDRNNFPPRKIQTGFHAPVVNSMANPNTANSIQNSQIASGLARSRPLPNPPIALQRIPAPVQVMLGESYSASLESSDLKKNLQSGFSTSADASSAHLPSYQKHSHHGEVGYIDKKLEHLASFSSDSHSGKKKTDLLSLSPTIHENHRFVNNSLYASPQLGKRHIHQIAQDFQFEIEAAVAHSRQSSPLRVVNSPDSEIDEQIGRPAANSVVQSENRSQDGSERTSSLIKDTNVPVQISVDGSPNSNPSDVEINLKANLVSKMELTPSYIPAHNIRVKLPRNQTAKDDDTIPMALGLSISKSLYKLTASSPSPAKENLISLQVAKKAIRKSAKKVRPGRFWHDTETVKDIKSIENQNGRLGNLDKRGFSRREIEAWLNIQ